MTGKQVRRRMRRFPLMCPVGYTSLEGTGQGTVVDISLDGIRINGKFAVKPGMSLSLLLHLADGQPPAKVQGATVQWTKGTRFGVKLPLLTADMRKRLMAYLCVNPQAEQQLFENPTALQQETAQVLDSSKPTVLVVHEDPQVLQGAARALALESYTILQAPGSSEALQLYETHNDKIDLLLIGTRLSPPVLQVADVHSHFPRLTSDELIGRILQRKKSLRVVVLSDDLPVKNWRQGIKATPLPVVRTHQLASSLATAVRKALDEPPIEYDEAHAAFMASRRREVQWVD